MGRLVVLLAAGVSMVACAPLGPSQSLGKVAARSELPQTVGFVVFLRPETLKAVLEAREDSAVKVGRWWRMGNGLASVKVTDARGHHPHGVECGGVLFIEGAAGRCKLEVRNETDLQVQIAVSANGRDLLSGSSAGWDKPGLSVAPMASEAFPAFDLACIPGPAAMLRADLAAQPGVVRIGLFFSTEPEKTKRRPARLPTGGPQPMVRPVAAPYDYR
jgi:hypothetical protein